MVRMRQSKFLLIISLAALLSVVSTLSFGPRLAYGQEVGGGCKASADAGNHSTAALCYLDTANRLDRGFQTSVETRELQVDLFELARQQARLAGDPFIEADAIRAQAVVLSDDLEQHSEASTLAEESADLYLQADPDEQYPTYDPPLERVRRLYQISSFGYSNAGLFARRAGELDRAYEMFLLAFERGLFPYLPLDDKAPIYLGENETGKPVFGAGFGGVEGFLNRAIEVAVENEEYEDATAAYVLLLETAFDFFIHGFDHNSFGHSGTSGSEEIRTAISDSGLLTDSVAETLTETWRKLRDDVGSGSSQITDEGLRQVVDGISNNVAFVAPIASKEHGDHTLASTLFEMAGDAMRLISQQPAAERNDLRFAAQRYNSAATYARQADDSFRTENMYVKSAEAHTAFYEVNEVDRTTQGRQLDGDAYFNASRTAADRGDCSTAEALHRLHAEVMTLGGATPRDPARCTQAEVDPTATPDSQPTVTATAEPQQPSEEERLRQIAQAIVEYRALVRDFFASLGPEYFNQADFLLRQLREARWWAANDLPEFRAERAREVLDLERRASELISKFQDDAALYRDILDAIEGQFAGTPEHAELVEALNMMRGELNMTELNLALRAGAVEEFDGLFAQFRNDPNFAPDVLTAKAFRELMDGNVRIALEAARDALELDPEHPTATQLIKDLELEYLKRIRAQLTSELGANARLFNDKLNGHGEQGIGPLIVDIFTTGIGESVQSILGYYDALEQFAGINIDEAAKEIAGVRLIESLRARGITFDELSAMSLTRFKEVITREYNRDLSDEDAARLRTQLFDGLNNLDVNAIRRGEKTQYNIDIGTEYFDTEVLKPNVSDEIAKQFSALDTFMTFAPSARLGKLSNGSLFGRLGLSADATFGQAMVRASKVEELGRRLYQSKYGAAMVDFAYEWDSVVTMINDAIKNRVGDIAFEAGGTALNEAINALSEPAKKALQEELREISDAFIGTEGTAAVEGTVNTISGIFNWAGVNSDALRRGAHGVDKLETVESALVAGTQRESRMLTDPALATAAGRPDFERFAQQAADASYIGELSDARERLLQMDKPDPGAFQLLKEADEVLETMEQAASRVRSGDSAGARALYDTLQESSGSSFDQKFAARAAGLGEIREQLALVDRFKNKPPTDSDFAKAAVSKVLDPVTKTDSKSAAALDKIIRGLGWKAVGG